MQLTEFEERVIATIRKVINIPLEYHKNTHGQLLVKVAHPVRLDCDALDHAITDDCGIKTMTMGTDVDGVYWVSLSQNVFV